MNDSMINPSIVDLLEKVDNRYSLVVATSRRARQLIDGAEPTINEDKKPLTIAIDEVEEGNIDVKEGSDKAISSPDISKLEEIIGEDIKTEDIIGHDNNEAEEGLE